MALYFIGLGLNDEKDISVKGLELVKSSDAVYLEDYTSKLNCNVSDLEKFYDKKIFLADREFVEKGDGILEEAKTRNVCFLVVGDPFAATTHIDLFLRAKKLKIETKIVHNASVISAIGSTGLQVYKFGKTTSIPFTEEMYKPETPYNVIKDNLKIGLHTLVLLDLKDRKFMSAKEGIQYLLELELKLKKKIFTSDTKIIVVERLGNDNQKFYYGAIKDLLKKAFNKPLYCLIVPGKLHFMEEEAVISL